MVTNIMRTLALQLKTDLKVYNEGWIIFNFLKAQSLVSEKIPQLNWKTSTIVLIFLYGRQGAVALHLISLWPVEHFLLNETFPIKWNWDRYSTK